MINDLGNHLNDIGTMINDLGRHLNDVGTINNANIMKLIINLASLHVSGETKKMKIILDMTHFNDYICRKFINPNHKSQITNLKS